MRRNQWGHTPRMFTATAGAALSGGFAPPLLWSGIVITSLSKERATARQLLKLWREHWHIENKLHWVRDVTFDEDRSQVRTARIPQVMAALRNAAISLLRLCGAENIAAATRRYAARPALALAAVGLDLRE